jgi:transcriptional regulator with XRE-family HTH domain
MERPHRQYCEPMAQAGDKRRPARDAAPGSWQASLTAVIADQVRYYRNERRLSAQDLADRCEELGLAIPRPVLSNLETHRRNSVTVAELIVLAAALEVPPILLIAPVGRQPTMEILPGQPIGVWDAVLWFIGQAELAAGSGGKPLTVRRADEDSTVELFRYHRFLEDRAPRDAWALQDALYQAEHAETAEGADAARRVAEMIRANVETNVEDLRSVRARMRKRGLAPPELPAALLAALHEADSGREPPK